MNKDLLPKIQAPCPKKWYELDGDDKRRYCSECKLHVHNLSAMSARERSDFLQAPGHKCGAYRLTPQTHTISLRSWRILDRLRIFRPALTGLAFIIALFTGGCATTIREKADCPAPDYKTLKPVEKDENGKEVIMLGGIPFGEGRPLWKRILWPWGN